MAKVFITGSSDGLGLHAGQRLARDGHEVVLHARNAERAQVARKQLPQAAAVLIGDCARLDEMRALAEQANAYGRFDAVIHNVAIGYQERRRVETIDGLENVFAINTLAPYVLTTMMVRPQRLIYLSSGLHRSGRWQSDDLQWTRRRWNGTQANSDSKLHDVMLAFALARKWPEVKSNALEPGWVATKMGGPGAPDDLALGSLTQAWLAVSDAPAANVSGEYFFHQQRHDVSPAARDEAAQEALLAACAQLSGVSLPSGS